VADRDPAEFDIPVTEDYVPRAQRDVGRRRLLRAAATGCATLAVAGILGGGFAPARGGLPAPVDPPVAGPSVAASSVAAPPGTTGAAGSALDGYAITRLPQGTARAGHDSFYTARVTDKGLVNHGAGPAPGDPSASVTMRRYDRADGAGFFVTVLRPVTGDAATVGAQLLTGATAGASPTATFDTPIGTARMFSSIGNETTTHRAVVATPDHVVITVEGNGKARAPEISDLAQSIDH
jgi:hypothetical protein